MDSGRYEIRPLKKINLHIKQMPHAVYVFGFKGGKLVYHNGFTNWDSAEKIASNTLLAPEYQNIWETL